MHHGMKMYGRVDVWSPSCFGRFATGKDPCYPLDRKVGGPQSPSGRSGENKNIPPLPAIEHRFLGREFPTFFCLPEVRMYPEDTATGHLDTGFLGLPPVFKRMLRCVPSPELLLRAPDSNSSELRPVAARAANRPTPRHQFRKWKFRGPCLNSRLLTILTSSFPRCPYQKDKRATPGNLLA
jgi:hypothetical protein